MTTLTRRIAATAAAGVLAAGIASGVAGAEPVELIEPGGPTPAVDPCASTDASEVPRHRGPLLAHREDSNEPSEDETHADATERVLEEYPWLRSLMDHPSGASG